MWNWIKKIKEKKRQKRDYIRLLQTQSQLLENEDKEWKTLMLLRNPICGKQHNLE